MESLYDILKVTSFVATGIFGALALLTKYKGDDDKITRWGKIALGGILISSSISLGLYILETTKAKAAAQKAQADAEATTNRLAEIFSTATTTVDKQKESLAKTNELKTGLETAIEQQNKNLQRSDEIAEGMELSLLGQKQVLGGNQKILDGVLDTIQRQGEVQKNTGINLLAALSKDNPVKEASWWIHMSGDSRNAKDIFEFLFSIIPKDYEGITIGSVGFGPFLGISSLVEYSKPNGELVTSFPWVKDNEPRPEITLPRFLDNRAQIVDPKDIKFILSQKATPDGYNSAAIAYRDLSKRRVIGIIRVEFGKRFATFDDAEVFLRENKKLKPLRAFQVWDGDTAYHRVDFKMPADLQNSIINYWQKNLIKSDIHLYLENSAQLMISCKVKMAQIKKEDSTLYISFETASEPQMKVGIEEF